MVSLNKCNGGCNTVDDLYTKICAPSKTKDVNFEVFKMIKDINEVKMLLKHIPTYCKCKLDNTICNSNQKWNNNKRLCDCQKY